MITAERSSNAGTSLSVTGVQANQSTSPSAALNKSAWSSNGRFLLAGDAKGVLHMMTVQDNAIAFTAADETKLEMILLQPASDNTASAIVDEANARLALSPLKANADNINDDDA